MPFHSISLISILIESKKYLHQLIMNNSANMARHVTVVLILLQAGSATVFGVALISSVVVAKAISE
jgi:hypothetical protein